ncbi:MAG: DEAD/DEAH box helicase [Bernardetiaceae bacterium]|nr:DEAD/DEAH box helicase [Bernardetiaceae bacterium]
MELFEKLKKNYSVAVPRLALRNFYFTLQQDDYGTYLLLTDKEMRPMEPDYLAYNGHLRETLRSIFNIEKKNAEAILWEGEENHIYLRDHDYLMWSLRYCSNIQDAKGNALTFVPDEVRNISVQINYIEDKNLYEGKVYLVGGSRPISDFHFLTDSWCLYKDRIYQINSIGNNFSNIGLFNTHFEADYLEKYLTLLFSFFQNITLDFDDYEVIESSELLIPQKALFFEKVDESHALHVKIASVIADFDTKFLSDYEVDKVAQINDIELQVRLRAIDHTQQLLAVPDFADLLRKELGKKTSIYQDDNLFILPEEAAKTFISKLLPVILDNYLFFGSENLKSYKITTSKPKLLFSPSSGIDFLEADVSLEIEGESLALFEVIRQYNRQKYVKLSDGTQAMIDAQYMKKLERIFRKQKNKKAGVSFFDLPLVEELIEDKVAAQKVLSKSRKVFEGFNKLEKAKFEKPKSLNAELRSYQKQGYKWLSYLYKQNLGGCLADDMGLGKTLQTIALLSDIYPEEKKPSLIVMPKSLLFNWEKEIEKFNPSLTFYTHYGTERNIEDAMSHQLIFTTYAIMRNDIELLKEKKFHCIILDESQNIKNITTQTSKAVMLLNGEHRFALSGTPIENNLVELYSLFRFLNPTMFGSADDFNNYYARPIQEKQDKDVAQELRRKIYPFILRRLKKNVLKDLPPKVEQVLYAEMSKKQRLLYADRQKFYKDAIGKEIANMGIKGSQFFILQALTELRQLASVPEAKTNGKVISAKREILMEQLFDAVANGHKCLVFVNFLQAIENISEDLTAAGIDFVSMTGATRDRQALVNRFQNDKKCKVFLMTLKTGGVGLNLVAADMVYIFDPWWNTAAEIQAIDRTHRIGQDKTVFSYKIITKNSIEEKIMMLQEQKQALFDTVISSDNASIKSLSEQDIEYILS